MNNFEYLYEHNPDALIDLLLCYSLGHTCQTCYFAKYGYSFDLCGRNGEGEWGTIHWLASSPFK